MLELLLNPPPTAPVIVVAVLALAACAGSFFNVVIYRLTAQINGADPKTINPCKPARSFCPNCNRQLTWNENIPVLSYLLQKGKCKGCQCHISLQYPLVELAGLGIGITAWAMSATMIGAIQAWVGLSLLLCCAVIDGKTRKIPNKLTLPGTLALLALSFIPGGVTPTNAAIGAAGGFIFMLLLVEIGKFMFGRKKVTLTDHTPFKWVDNKFTLQDEGCTLEESEAIEAHEIFLRESDKVIIEGKIDESTQTVVELKNNDGKTVSGTAKTITFPQEAMGMGDTKLMLMIGAGFGWEIAIHGVAAGAILALLVQILLRFIARFRNQNTPGLIAFGPWIAAGCALAWWYHVQP